jgi:hypothetical protein
MLTDQRDSMLSRENALMTHDPLERLRAICLALPGVAEKLNHGMPSWVVRNRTTVIQFYDGTHRGGGIVGMWGPAPPGVLEDQIIQEPDRFYRPPYGGIGWLGVRLDRDVDWDGVAAIVAEAYRLVAPKRLVAELDADIPSEQP